MKLAITAGSWTGQQWGQHHRQPWVPGARLAGPNRPSLPAQQHTARRLQRPAAAHNAGEGGPKRVQSQSQKSRAQRLGPKQEDQLLWKEASQRVSDFQRQHGRLPRAYSDGSVPLLPGEQALGLWCFDQQQRKVGGKHPRLTKYEKWYLQQLKGIEGWAWWPGQHVQVRWEKRREQLEAFVKQHGRLPQRQGSTGAPLVPGETDLWTWCNTQRQRWNYPLCCEQPLTAEQEAALSAIPGWAWSARDGRWEQQREQVEAFVRQHGRLPRAQGSKGVPLLLEEKELGVWCAAQRQRWDNPNRSCLEPEQEAALNATPGWAWSLRDDTWQQRRKQLEAFVRQHGRMPRMRPTPQDPLFEGERQLASWRERQKRRLKGYRGCTPLSDEQVDALEAISGWDV